jgi:hypothetical protein
VGVDGHHLDLVRATTDGLFKAMNSRMHSVYGPTRVVCWERGELSRSRYSQSSEAPYETRVHKPASRRLRLKGTEIFFHPRRFHRNCTVRQQFFHSLTPKVAHRTLKHT